MPQGRSPRGSRDVLERLMVRFPGAWRALAVVAWRFLSPRSRLRRWGLRREMISAYDAVTRRDFELMFVRYSPDLEITFDPEFAGLGMGGTFEGHDGMLKMIGLFEEAWEQPEMTAVAVLDFGDRLLTFGRFHLLANTSGLKFDPEFAQIVTIARGLIGHEREFLSWAKGLQEAGVDVDTAQQILASLDRA